MVDVPTVHKRTVHVILCLIPLGQLMQDVEGGVVEGEGKKTFIPLTAHCVHTSHLLSQ